MLLLRLSGLLLLRLAERQFSALLFQEPPRKTRFVFGPAPGKRPVQRQSPDHRLQNIHQEMVDHPVAERRGRDHARLGTGYPVGGEGAGAI